MAQYSPKRSLAGFTPEQSESLLVELDRVAQSLRATIRDASPEVRTDDVVARPNQFLRMSPQVEGQALVLPAPRSVQLGDTVTVSVEIPVGVLRVQAVSSTTETGVEQATVNGQPLVTFTQPGLITFTCNGESNWTTASEHPAETAAVSAASFRANNAEPYVTHGPPSGALTNHRQAKAAAEISPVLTTAKVISWAINAASVVAGKLAAVTGRSVFLKAATGAGAPAEVAAGDDEFLGTSGTGALGFRKVHAAALASDVNWAAVLSRGASSGSNTPEIANGQKLLFDTAGDQSYTVTAGQVAASGNLQIGADGQMLLTPGAGQDVYLNRGFLRFIEQGASTPSMLGGQALFWVQNLTPNVPMFKDDVNVDHRLQYTLSRRTVNSAGGTQADVDVSATDVLVVSATATFNGFAGGHDGKILVINAGSAATVTIPHNGGSAGNRPFVPNGSNLIVSAFGSAALIYDGDSSAWRVLSFPSLFASGVPGLAPASNGSATEYVNGAGSWIELPAQDWSWTGIHSFGSQVRLTGTITPSVSSDQDNWAPTGIEGANTILADVTGTREITGIDAQPDGTILVITNVGTGILNFAANGDTSSDAENRILWANSLGVGLLSNGSVVLRYDGNDSRWRPIACCGDYNRSG